MLPAPSNTTILRKRSRVAAAILLGAIALCSVWNLVRAEKATPENLGGPERYLTCVSTDKPIYKPGEKMYARGFLLHAAKHTPLAASAGQGNAMIEIKGPKGDTVFSGSVNSADSAWGFAWEIPSAQAGGEYTLRASYPWEGYAPAERKFDIRAYRAPRLRSQIVFLRDGYGPGDKVSATLHTERAEGGIPEGASVRVTARVDGMAVEGAPAKVDASGNCAVTLELPREIPRGEGALALIIQDGGAVETASKTIPILLQAVDVKIYPEGGDLLAGAPNRVYFEARTPAQKPADIAGVVLDDKGATVAQFRSEHEGRGRFDFQPAAGGAYVLRIDEPAGIKKTIALPAAKAGGATLRVKEQLVAAGQPVTLAWATAGYGDVKLALTQREVELDSKVLNYEKERSLKDGAPFAWTQLDAKGAEGVLIVTIYDAKTDLPLAERLVYRQPAKKLNVSITANQRAYVPGGIATLTIKTTDADGKPVQAVAGITVTDDSVLEMVDKREQAPRLPAMALLEPEVQELADAQIYLDESNPKAPAALDLLLGTQGWRRFALADPVKFAAEHGDAARRALAMRVVSQREERKAKDFLDGAVPVPAPAGMAMNKPEAINLNDPDGVDKGAGEPNNAGKLAAVQEKLHADQPVKKDAAPQTPAIQEAQNKLQRNMADALEKADRQADDKKVMGAKRMAGQRPADPPAAFIVIREFAHQVRAGRQPNDRVDFSETLYWNAGVKTNANGEATVTFGLSDSVTTFRVSADVLAASGGVAAATQTISAVQPFYTEPKLPLEVTTGDQILLPIGVVNALGSDLGGATLRASLKGEFKLGELAAFDLKALDRVRQILPIKVGFNRGPAEFTLNAAAGPYSDKVVRMLNVTPKGFPIEVPFGGMLGGGGAADAVKHTLTIPEGVVPRSLITRIAVYPTPLANMTEALQRLIQDPCGCFEQTSSTSYPLTMAQQYFLSHTGVDAKLVEASREKLDAGYKRLVGFWCPDRGYEWFGENPGHEALTAFGLLHFSDMAQVREVDRNMVEQTRAWLLKQRDGKGGFERKRRALHTWIEDKDCSNAYILWALLETGAKDLNTEVAALKTAAASSQNSYVVALAANAMSLSGDVETATALMRKLAAKQNANSGMVGGGTASIVGSSGESLEVESTALAALAWMRNPEFAGNTEAAMKYLADSCKSGRYGSTQSTVLALRAIVTYDKLRAHPKAPGKVRVFVDGQSIGGPVAFDEKSQGAIQLPDLSELLTKGEHAIELKMEGGGAMPYSIAVNYSALVPASSKDCKVDIAVKLAQDHVEEGAVTEANVTVSNKTGEAVPTPVAIVGIPGGLEPRHEQLKELVKKGTIDAYEVMGRNVVLYWRAMKANDRVEIPLSLVAAVPGSYTGPASRAYLYYSDEHKVWVDGVAVTIAPKGN